MYEKDAFGDPSWDDPEARAAILSAERGILTGNGQMNMKKSGRDLPDLTDRRCDCRLPDA